MLKWLFLRLWRMWGISPRPHLHDWWREARITDPPTEVFGCLVPRCEKRRYVALGKGLRPDDVHDCVVNPGGSPANALNVVTGMKMGHFASADMNGLPPPILCLKEKH